MSNAVVSFADLIFHQALSWPDKPAVILPDRVATYDMMAQGILRVEVRIKALDLPPGALVCLSFNNPIRHLIVGAALFRLGHPVISAAQPNELLASFPLARSCTKPAWLSCRANGSGSSTTHGSAGERQALAASPPKGFADDQKICCVAMSSGTTGRPKAISLTIKAFQQWVMNYYSTIGLGTWERLILLIGLNSSWGFTIAAHGLFAGRTLVFAANPRETLHLIAVYGVDAMAATTVQLREILRQQAEEPMPCTSLRTVLPAAVWPRGR